MANTQEEIHAARISLQCLSQLLSERSVVHFRSRVTDDRCVHGQERVRKEGKQRRIGLFGEAYSTIVTFNIARFPEAPITTMDNVPS